MSWLLYLALVSPLVGAALIGFLGTWWRKRAHWVGVPAIGIPMVISWFFLWKAYQGETVSVQLFDWITAGKLHVSFGLLLDGLSAVMLFVVATVSFFIHIYSIGYMGKDPGYRRFFSYLNLFVFAMELLVLADSYPLMFVGWEGVGLCSYLLIGFWYEKLSASNAGKKAFIVNRIGDAGFLLAIFTMLWTFGDASFRGVAHAAEHAAPWLLGAVALLLFLGAVGKSAQIPLYVWLPDAMEGPTPVSALIHAATMVTAGVYMVARSSFIYSKVPWVGVIVASIGAATAIFAASMALVNNDIKRILAYSTISQLGYMFMAVGLGAYAAGIFHLYTHAFFKALLFLAAGSVMHAMRDELNIWKMGGLAKKLPQTASVFVIGSLALAAIPPTSGFFSKDEILHHAFAGGHTLIWSIGLITALMTAFYMFRAVFVVFAGEPRDRELHAHAHESPPVMTAPMWVLAFGALAAGWFGPQIHRLVSGAVHPVHGHEAVSVNPWVLAAVSVGAGVLGILIAAFMYWKPGFRNELLARMTRPIYLLLYHKYWVDEIYEWLVVKPLWGLSKYFIYPVIDSGLIDRGIVDGVGKLAWALGSPLRKLQVGRTRVYGVLMLLGLAVILFLFLAGGK